MIIKTHLSSSQAYNIALTNWWQHLTPRKVITRQLFTDKWIMPLGDFLRHLSSFFHRHISPSELFAVNIEKLQRAFITLTTAE